MASTFCSRWHLPVSAWLLTVAAASLLLFMPGCASGRNVSINQLNMDFSRVKSSLNRSGPNYQKLNKYHVGKTGFYYIINTEGIVVHHPQALLIGRSFREYWFIEMILREQSGCLQYSIDDRQHTIYFKPLNNDLILCLSIMSDEVHDPEVQCKSVAGKNDDPSAADTAEPAVELVPREK